MVFIYALICLGATAIGALSGMGGGVIIKPLFDFIGFHSIEMINFLSVVAVFVMACSSTLQQVRAKTKIDFRFVAAIALGSIVGGILGGQLFDAFLLQVGAEIAKGTQSLLLALFMVLVIVYFKGNFKNYSFQHPLVIIGIGFVLGTTASFLGVGGGPINVAFISFFFALDMKMTAVYSIAVILFAQGSKLLTMYHATQFAGFDLQWLWVVIPVALLGGVLGAKWNQSMHETKIKQVFLMVSYGLVVLNLYNALQALWF
ncbi:MAG: sulfite exporter TauE/SafE family protein [Erysipelotrichaceae bacterium]